MISLFVYCLDREKTTSDLALLDIGTGYFARLSLDTGSLVSVPFVRAITSLIYSYEPTTLDIPLHEHLQLTQDDADAMLHLEDWSIFSRASPAEMSMERIF